jgi:dTDP-4-amino-4,6-dideoxygalactose transaminase
MINVTKTYLPDPEKYKTYVDRIFKSGWVTNNGELVNELENRLKNYLGVKNLLLVSNGTLALQTAYKLLKIKGSAITTPFSFVATTSSLVWEGVRPVYADIDNETFNIDPKKIIDRIAKDTSAVVPVHVFGNACEIEKLESLCSEQNLKLVFDAAHAFGVNYKNRSICSFGDISILSFHATKIFHTIEGGAIIINDDSLYEKAKLMINFGIPGPDQITELGINCKLNEFQAAMGLCIMDDLDKIFNKRKIIYQNYLSAFNSNQNLKLQKQNDDSTINYSYFSIVLKDELVLQQVTAELLKNTIIPRRYFYPSLNLLSYLDEKQKMPVSESISKAILCLPIFYELSDSEQQIIVESIENIIGK